MNFVITGATRRRASEAAVAIGIHPRKLVSDALKARVRSVETEKTFESTLADARSRYMLSTDRLIDEIQASVSLVGELTVEVDPEDRLTLQVLAFYSEMPLGQFLDETIHQYSTQLLNTANVRNAIRPESPWRPGRSVAVRHDVDTDVLRFQFAPSNPIGRGVPERDLWVLPTQFGIGIAREPTIFVTAFANATEIARLSVVDGPMRRLVGDPAYESALELLVDASGGEQSTPLTDFQHAACEQHWFGLVEDLLMRSEDPLRPLRINETLSTLRGPIVWTDGVTF